MVKKFLDVSGNITFWDEELQAFVGRDPAELNILKRQISLQSIYDDLSKYISGQVAAKKKVASIGYMHYLKIKNRTRVQAMPNLNFFVVGPSGFGKTYLIESLAKSLSLPMHRIDMTNTVGSGWHGVSFDEKIKDIIEDLNPGLHGGVVLFLDEVDKLCAKDGNSDHSGHSRSVIHLQQNLLDLLNGEYREKSGKLSPINNALVVLGGSFQLQRDVHKAESEKKSIGYGAEFNKQYDATTFFKESEWKTRLIELGLIPELVNRLSGCVSLDRLSKDEIKKVLLEAQDNVYAKYKNVFGYNSQLAHVEMLDLIDTVYNSNVGLREIQAYLFKYTVNSLEKHIVTDE